MHYAYELLTKFAGYRKFPLDGQAGFYHGAAYHHFTKLFKGTDQEEIEKVLDKEGSSILS